jgi:hypothetical protein
MVKYAIAFVFILFAIVQYNDSDPYLWIAIYGSIGMVYLWKEVPKSLLYFMVFSLSIFLATYIPSFIEWINDGLPSITGTMKAENPEVENIREFLGLTLGTLAIVFLIRQKK